MDGQNGLYPYILIFSLKGMTCCVLNSGMNVTCVVVTLYFYISDLIFYLVGVTRETILKISCDNG